MQQAQQPPLGAVALLHCEGWKIEIVMKDSEMEMMAVEYTVLGLAPVRDAGRLIALANVEIAIGGVAIVLQGVQLIRDAAGNVSVQAPRFRDGAGVWRSAVILPDSLRDALGDEVLAAWRATAAVAA
jgi:hypothetical protein